MASETFLLDVDFSLVFPHPGSPSIDHIIPRAAGGKDFPNNLRLAHFRCNSKKSYLPTPKNFPISLEIENLLNFLAIMAAGKKAVMGGKSLDFNQKDSFSKQHGLKIIDFVPVSELVLQKDPASIDLSHSILIQFSR